MYLLTKERFFRETIVIKVASFGDFLFINRTKLGIYVLSYKRNVVQNREFTVNELASIVAFSQIARLLVLQQTQTGCYLPQTEKKD